MLPVPGWPPWTSEYETVTWPFGSVILFELLPQMMLFATSTGPLAATRIAVTPLGTVLSAIVQPSNSAPARAPVPASVSRMPEG